MSETLQPLLDVETSGHHSIHPHFSEHLTELRFAGQLRELARHEECRHLAHRRRRRFDRRAKRSQTFRPALTVLIVDRLRLLNCHQRCIQCGALVGVSGDRVGKGRAAPPNPMEDPTGVARRCRGFRRDVAQHARRTQRSPGCLPWPRWQARHELRLDFRFGAESRASTASVHSSRSSSDPIESADSGPCTRIGVLC